MRPVRGTANPPSGGNYAGTNRFPPGQHQDSESGGFGDDPWAASTSLDAGAMEDTPMDTSTPVSFEDEPPLLEGGSRAIVRGRCGAGRARCAVKVSVLV